MRSLLAIALLFLGLASCSPKHTGFNPPVKESIEQKKPHRPIETGVAFSDPTWQKRWWIEKTARVLRAGAGLGPKDDIHKLLSQSEDQIIADMMKDNRFADTVLDFNMYVMGFRTDSLREEDGTYVRAAFDMANTIQSAKAVLNNGDYLKLFEFDAGLFIPPLRMEPEEEDGQKGPMDKARKEAVAKMVKRFKDLIKLGKSKPKPEAFCKAAETFVRTQEQANEELHGPFDNVEVVLERSEVLQDGPDLESCTDAKNADVEGMTEETEEQLEIFEKGFAEILKFEPKVYKPMTVAEMKPFDLRAVSSEISGMFISFSNEMNTALANSSTNMNRKRSAYVLKHFFCDDLTPVGFENPAEHTGGAHGSQTSCYACHYKLDPMAGFFRIFGSQFQDYSKQDELIFDDSVTTPRAAYEDNWKAPNGSPRTWNVGYIRSPDPRFESKNEYGETLADLTKILRKAPEVRRCLMRRLFEYTVAENQVIDGAYLDELTKKFEADAATNSTAALKNALARILKSRTFAEPNPDPNQCYDHGPNGSSPTDPPCRVASILQTYCKNCHSSTSGSGNLDLTKWIQLPDGTFSFPHEDGSGNQVARAETFSVISERLTTNDAKKRMPKGGTMPSQERQQLFIWAQEQLSGR